MSRRLFIGDIHGCVAELESLLEKFSFQPTVDEIYSVGDVIGKGPYPTETLKLLFSINAQMVLGNHEVYHLQLAKQNKPSHLPPEYMDWVISWPYYRELTDFFVVHAGFDPRYSHPAQMDPKILTTIRTWDGIGVQLSRESNPAWFDLMIPSKPIIFGHWAKRGLVYKPGFFGLDTGCVYGKSLTGYCPETQQLIQTKAEKAYCPIPNEH